MNKNSFNGRRGIVVALKANFLIVEIYHEDSKDYNIVVYTAKAKPDRPLINGKTGQELVWEWLEKYDMDKFVTKVTAEKPRAVAYIDDKGFRFSDWDSCMTQMKSNGLI